MKLAVIGARCNRQGIGEHVARLFADAGADVCAVAGTSLASNATALEKLAQYDLHPRGYVSVGDLLAAETPDAVAICSPYRFHREHLEMVAQAGAHCLCEKPMWWEDHDDRRAETARLVQAFVGRGLFLSLVTQWPFTLDGYFTLYPELRGTEVKHFEMLLSPARGGPEMVLDAAPHVVSILQALVGPGKVRAARGEFVGGDTRNLIVDFRYHPEGEAPRAHQVSNAGVEVVCRFSTAERSPRPASYAINGHKVDRRIDMSRYDMYFETGARSVLLEDPLKILVRDFLKRVETGVSAEKEILIEGICSLETLYATVA